MVARYRSPRDNKIDNPDIIFIVPSGNFGNLTSGLIAQKMGAPITGFVAATNSNRTVPDWVATGDYKPRPSVATLSNAMDVGAPSNFERMVSMYTLSQLKQIMASYWLDDEGTLKAIENCNRSTGYIIDPHGAVGWQAWKDIRNGSMENLMAGITGNPEKPGLTPSLPQWADKVKTSALGIILETAHPAKFGATVYDAIGREPPLPDRLERVLRLPDCSVAMGKDYASFKEWLVENL